MPLIPQDKIDELVAADGGKSELFVLTNGNNDEQAVVKIPDRETWKRYRMMVADSQKVAVANERLVYDCLVYPDLPTMKGVFERRPALADTWALRIQEMAGTDGIATKKALSPSR